MFEEDVACDDCHGYGSDIRKPEAAVCVDCHDEEYEEMPAEWKGDVAEAASELKILLDAVPPAARSSKAFADASQLLKDIDRGGAKGVHNYDLMLDLLSEFSRTLRTESSPSSP
jgi:hypothetical protein